MVEAATKPIAKKGREYKKKDKQATGLVIEEKTYNEEVAIAESEWTRRGVRIRTAYPPQKTKPDKDKKEESPEVELGKE